MLVYNRMSRKVVTIPPDCPLADARALLLRHEIRQLPVVRAGSVVGIVTDRDLRSAKAAAKTVADVMTSKPLVTTPQSSVDEAARILRMRKINALPVTDGPRLVGILTASDVLDAFVDLSGVAEPTYRFSLVASGIESPARRIREIVEARRSELKWLHEEKRGERTQIHLRLKTRRPDDISDALEAAGFEVCALVAAQPAPRQRQR